MRLILYLALLYTCYFLAIGVDSVAAKRKKCYYVDENNNRLGLVSHQRESSKHKTVDAPKEFDTKNQKHPTRDQNTKTSENEPVSMSQTVEKSKYEIKPDHDKSNRITKTEKISSKNHNDHGDKRRNSIRHERVHYNHRPSDLSSNTKKTIPKISNDHKKIKAGKTHFQASKDVNNKSKEFKNKSSGKQKQVKPAIETKTKVSRDKDARQVKEQSKNLKSVSEQRSNKNYEEKVQKIKNFEENSGSKNVSNVNSEKDGKMRSAHDEPKHQISKTLDSVLKTRKRSNSKSSLSIQSDEDERKQTTKKQKHSSEILFKPDDQVPLSHPHSRVTKKETTSTIKTKSLALKPPQKNHKINSQSSKQQTLVQTSNPMSTNNSETEMNDFQKEMSQVIAFLQKLVTYGPIVNPKAYTPAPKCPEYFESMIKCGSRNERESEGQKFDDKNSQAKPFEHAEPDTKNSSVQPILKEKIADKHAYEVYKNSEQLSRVEHERVTLNDPSNQTSAVDPSVESNNTESMNVNQKPISENEHDQSEQDIINNSEIEPKKQIDTENKENDIKYENTQEKPANQSISNNLEPSPVLDSEAYERSMLESANGTDPLNDPKFQTIFAPNPEYQHTGDAEPKMIPMVVPYQPKENPDERSEGSVTAESTPDLENPETQTNTELSTLESTTESEATESTVHEEVVEPSIQEEVAKSTQSPAPIITPGNPWLMHIFGKFSHLVKIP